MITVVIPTLQKNKKILYDLVSKVNLDAKVTEIIVIDNSLQGIDFVSDKLQVIIPKENLFVNPSWNLGAQLASNDMVAILNDDIIIPENYCSSVVSLMKPGFGVVGMDFKYVSPIDKYETPAVSEKINLVPITCRNPHWGIAIFCHKDSYFPIPDNIKIWAGDEYLIWMNKKHNRKNFKISGQDIYHWGSLSCSENSFSKMLQEDKRLYRKITIKWYHRLFSIEEIYEAYKVRILGITWIIKKKRDLS